MADREIELVQSLDCNLVTFKGTQIAYECAFGVMLICDSDEDFENDDLSDEEIEAIVEAMPSIEAYIDTAGFQITREKLPMTDDSVEYDKQYKLETDRRDLRTSIEGLVMVYLNKLVDRDIAQVTHERAKGIGGSFQNMDDISSRALRLATDMAAEIDRVVKEKLPG